jgi:hypothetical protein
MRCAGRRKCAKSKLPVNLHFVEIVVPFIEFLQVDSTLSPINSIPRIGPTIAQQ